MNSYKLDDKIRQTIMLFYELIVVTTMKKVVLQILNLASKILYLKYFYNHMCIYLQTQNNIKHIYIFITRQLDNNILLVCKI